MNILSSHKTLFIALLVYLLPLTLAAQDSVLEDHAPLNFACNDTTRYTATGYIAASYCVLDGFDVGNYNYGVCISGAIPVRKTNFGVAAKIGFFSSPIPFATSRFNEYYAIVGPRYTLQLNTRYSFDIRLLAGVTYCVYPEQEYNQINGYINTYGNTTSDSTVSSRVTINGTNSLVFMVQAGIGFKYVFTHKLGLMLNVDYTKRYSLSLTQNTTNISAAITYFYDNSATYSKNYTYPPNTTSVSYFGSNDPLGFTVFSLGIFYEIGNGVLKK